MVKNKNSKRVNMCGDDMVVTQRDNVSVFHIPIYSETTCVSSLNNEDFEKYTKKIKVFNVPVFTDVSYTYYFGENEEG